MAEKKIVRTLSQFSLGFHPINGVNLVQYDDASVGFRLRFAEEKSATTTTTETVAVTEDQVDLILRLMVAHRDAYKVGDR